MSLSFILFLLLLIAGLLLFLTKTLNVVSKDEFEGEEDVLFYITDPGLDLEELRQRSAQADEMSPVKGIWSPMFDDNDNIATSQQADGWHGLLSLMEPRISESIGPASRITFLPLVVILRQRM